MGLIVLEEYNYVNKPSLSAIENFRRWVLENTPNGSDDTPGPQLLNDHLNHIFRSIGLFGQDLGYDFTKRMPQKHQIHMLSEEKYSELLKKYNDDSNFSKVLSIPHFKDIFVKWIERRTIFSTLCGIQHDLIHQISSKNVYLNPKTGNFIVSFGYCIPPQTNHKLLTEALTEMVSLQIIQNYWHNDPFLKNIVITNHPTVFKQTIREIETKVRAASKRTGRSYEDIFMDLTRGLIEGKISNLNVLENAP